MQQDMKRVIIISRQGSSPIYQYAPEIVDKDNYLSKGFEANHFIDEFIGDWLRKLSTDEKLKLYPSLPVELQETCGPLILPDWEDKMVPVILKFYKERYRYSHVFLNTEGEVTTSDQAQYDAYYLLWDHTPLQTLSGDSNLVIKLSERKKLLEAVCKDIFFKTPPDGQALLLIHDKEWGTPGRTPIYRLYDLTKKEIDFLGGKEQADFYKEYFEAIAVFMHPMNKSYQSTIVSLLKDFKNE